MNPDTNHRRQLLPAVLLILTAALCLCGISCRAILEDLTDYAVGELESKLNEWIDGIPTSGAEPTEAPTEPPTEVPVGTEPDTFLPVITEAPTEAPTVPATEAPTEVPTEAPTEVPTEPAAECKHTFPYWKDDPAPTCTKPGARRRTCLKCGLVEEEPIPAAGHAPVTSVVHVDATLLQNGCDVTSVTCSVCGELLSRTVRETDAFTDRYAILRRLLTDGLVAGEDAVDISGTNIPYNVEGVKEIERVINEVFYSYGLITARSSYSMRGDSKGYVTQVVFDYDDPPAERARKRAASEQALQDIIAQVPDGLTDLEIALFLHDYIVEHFVYDETLEIHDMHTMLATGTGVCQAYTLLYAELLRRFNIPVTYAHSLELNHIWNVVAIDGMTYHVDVTWDDPVGNHPGRVQHTNFLLTDEEMHRTHGTSWRCSETCTDRRFDIWWLHSVTSPVVFTNGAVFAIYDRTLLRADTLNDPKPVSVYEYSPWRLYGTNAYYNHVCYAGLGVRGGKLYTNTCEQFLCIDPATGHTDVLPFTPEGGYIYGMTLDGDTMTYLVAKDETQESVVGLFAVTLD